MKILSCTIVSLVCCLLGSVDSYKILGLFAFPSSSHYKIGSALMRGLAEKGHEITVIAAYEEKSPVANFTTIFIPEAEPDLQSEYIIT